MIYHTLGMPLLHVLKWCSPDTLWWVYLHLISERYLFSLQMLRQWERTGCVRNYQLYITYVSADKQRSPFNAVAKKSYSFCKHKLKVWTFARNLYRTRRFLCTTSHCRTADLSQRSDTDCSGFEDSAWNCRYFSQFGPFFLGLYFWKGLLVLWIKLQAVCACCNTNSRTLFT